MSKAISVNNLGATLAMVLIAVLLLLLTVVFVVQQSATSGDSTASPAIRAGDAGGSRIDRDPYIERHAEVVARHNEGRLGE